MESSAAQRYIAEFVGTFFLLVGVTGAALVTLQSVTVGGYIPSLGISIAIGLVLAVSIYALGDVSGGHFNPAVTIAMLLSRRMPMRDAVPYIVAQVVGALVGVFAVAAWAHGSPAGWNTMVTTSFASQGYSANNGYLYSLSSVFFFEVVATFLFLFIILRVTRPDSGVKNLAPLTIGFALLMVNLIGIGIDGASFNPARSFAPAIVSQIWPPATGAWALGQSWVFWLAPIVGAVLAAVVEMAVFSPKKTSAPTAGASSDPRV
jgi:aquaporin Z